MNQRVSREEVRAALTGPVTSVKIPFQRDGSIDFAGLRTYIEFVLAAGSRALILTYGDSLYSVLSDQEVEEVTRAVVEDAAGRALVVAGDRMWATPQAVAFARVRARGRRAPRDAAPADLGQLPHAADFRRALRGAWRRRCRSCSSRRRSPPIRCRRGWR